MRECYGSGFTSKLPVQHDETVAAKEQQLDSQCHSGADGPYVESNACPKARL
jgi:hypothetical protein